LITQSALSLQYVQAAVTATAAGAPVNPTSDVVQFAFKAGGANPASGDWVTGSWDGTATRGPGNAYIAQCLVGPGGTITLGVDTYTMWIKVTDSPEIPVIPVGLLQIV
jgi:hypothetical protein